MVRTFVFESGSGDFGRNRIINGACDTFMHNEASTAIDTSYGYDTVDRFQLIHVPAGAITSPVSFKSATVPPTGNSVNSTELNSSHSSNAGSLEARQFIESKNAFDLVGKDISFGVQVQSDSAINVDLRILLPVTIDTFSGAVVLSQVSIPIPNDSSWNLIALNNILAGSNAINGIVVELSFSDFQNQSGTRIHRFTEVQLTEGISTKPFTRFGGASLGMEYLAIQRYYEHTPGPLNPMAFSFNVNDETTEIVSLDTGVLRGANTIRFREPKRIVPTMLTAHTGDSSLTTYAGGDTSRFSAAQIGGSSSDLTNGQLNIGLTSFNFATILANTPASRNIAYFKWAADAEIT